MFFNKDFFWSCVNKFVLFFMAIIFLYNFNAYHQNRYEEMENKFIATKEKLNKTYGELDNIKVENMFLSVENRAYKMENMWNVEMTAYTARPEETNSDPGNTAIMEKPKPGWSIAVSQDLHFLLGKRVYIKGLGVRYVNDLMNKRYSKRVDVLVDTVDKAKEIGLKDNVKLVLIEPIFIFDKAIANNKSNDNLLLANK